METINIVVPRNRKNLNNENRLDWIIDYKFLAQVSESSIYVVDEETIESVLLAAAEINTEKNTRETR